MKAAFKWRLQNGIYGYLTDETGNGDPFAYDVAQQSRIYIDGTIITGSTVNESLIANSVSRMLKEEYISAFNKFKELVELKYPQVTLLDVIYYYNVESDECTASASSLKCSATDIIFDATAVTGSPVNVVVTNEQTDPNSGEELRYRIDFTIPAGEQGPVGPTPNLQVGEVETITLDPTENASVTVTRQPDSTDLNPKFDFEFEIPRGRGVDVNNNFTAVTISSTTTISKEITATTVSANTIITSSITADEFVKSGGTDVQYLMADGSVTILSAGTNVHIATGGTADERIITISSNDIDSNTWRNINVDGNPFIGTGITTGALNLSAGTNIALTTGSGGTVVISSTNSSTDTKNTAGTTNSTDKIYLVGGKTQDTYTTTYSNSNVYASGGTIYANNFYINGGGGGVISITDMMPTGSITMWPGDTAPTGWVICDGSDLGVTKLLSWNIGVTKFTDSKQGQKLGGILAATSANDTWPYYKDHKVCLFRKGTTTTFQICTSATVSTVSGLVKITNATWVNYPGSERPREFNSEELGDAWNDYSKLDFSALVGTDITLGKMICLPDFRLRFPLGALSGGTIGINNDDNRNGWSTTIGKTGGEEGHTLKAHLLNPTYYEYPLLKIENKGINTAGSYDVVTGLESLTAQNAHNNIPPYLAINFIIKYA